MAAPESKSKVNQNPILQSYYASLETRIGFRFLLGGARHFGYYDTDTWWQRWWPLPINKALRRMEDRLFHTLNVPIGGTVLDAGCGNGLVAIHMANQGLIVHGIDIIDRHISRARSNVRAAGLEKAITIQKADYHHLEEFEADSLDGIYTIETLVHATDVKSVLAGFHRVLKPGGSLVLFEYAHFASNDAESAMLLDKVNEYAAMPANAGFEVNVLRSLAEETGFENAQTENLSENVKPMLRLFYVLAYLPYMLIRLLGLEKYFINTVAAIVAYRYYEQHQYVAIRATKSL